MIGGRHYGELREPFRHVGAVLEADAFHPGPRARDHLRVLATAARLPLERVGAVLREVDLADAGAIRTSATDLLRFLAASLAPPDEPPGPALARAAEPRFTINKRLALGLGWMVLRRKDRPVTIWHSGGTWGFRSFAAMVPERRTGVVVLSNTTRSVDRLGIKLVDRLSS